MESLARVKSMNEETGVEFEDWNRRLGRAGQGLHGAILDGTAGRPNIRRSEGPENYRRRN